MSRSGPAPQPTNLVLLKGNPGKRKRPEEPKPTPVAPTRPDWLSADGRKAWDELAPELERVGLLTKVDGFGFALACEDLAIARAALRSIRRGTGYSVLTKDRAHGGEPRKHPALMVYRQHADAFRAWCKEYGLTPSARVGLPAPGDDGDEDDDLLD